MNIERLEKGKRITAEIDSWEKYLALLNKADLNKADGLRLYVGGIYHSVPSSSSTHAVAIALERDRVTRVLAELRAEFEAL